MLSIAALEWLPDYMMLEEPNIAISNAHAATLSFIRPNSTKLPV